MGRTKSSSGPWVSRLGGPCAQVSPRTRSAQGPGPPKDQVSPRKRLQLPAAPPASPGQCPAPAPGQLVAGPHTSVLAHCPPAVAAGWQPCRPGSAGRAAPAGPQGSQPFRRGLESLGIRHRSLVREGSGEDSVYPPIKHQTGGDREVTEETLSEGRHPLL